MVAFEATHRSQAPLQLPVVGFHSVVGVNLRTVPRTRGQLINNIRVDRRLISGDLHRDHLRGGLRPGEKTPGRATVPPRGHIHVDDLPELVDRPVYVAPPTGHLDVSLIHPPAVPDTVPAWCAACASSGVKRCTQRKILTWSTVMPRSARSS